MNLLGVIAKHAVNYLDLGVDLRPFSAVCSSLSADGDIMRSEAKARPQAKSYGHYSTISNPTTVSQYQWQKSVRCRWLQA